MKQWYMLTVSGRDQPGILAGLSSALYQAGANLGEAAMARLGGNFTIMLNAETEADEAALRRQIDPVAQKMHLHVHIDRLEGRLHQRAEPNVQIAVHGADRPGMVAQVSAALTAAGLSILDLDSHVGGTADKPVYIMVIDGYAPGGMQTVERALEPIRLSGIEVQLSPINSTGG